MDVRNGRDLNEVIVLGSGLSILNLTDGQKKHINRCKTVIAMNKFMAFYEKAGILPTHVYFLDIHDNSIKFLEYTITFCKKKRVQGITWFINEQIQSRFYRSDRSKWRVIVGDVFWDLFF